jgi:hypothetical protein
MQAIALGVEQARQQAGERHNLGQKTKADAALRARGKANAAGEMGKAGQ